MVGDYRLAPEGGGGIRRKNNPTKILAAGFEWRFLSRAVDFVPADR